MNSRINFHRSTPLSQKFTLSVSTDNTKRKFSPDDPPNNSLSLLSKNSPLFPLQKKTLTTIRENHEIEPKTHSYNRFLSPNPTKIPGSVLLKMKEMFQFKLKPKEIMDADNEKHNRFNEIAKMMKGNHEIYFKKKDNEDFSSDFKFHYESQYNKHKALYKPTYFLDVIEFNDREKAALYIDNFPCFPLRKKLLYWKTMISFLCEILTQHPYFKIFTILLIWINSLIFAMNKIGLIDNYLDSDFYDIIILMFFCEIIVKILAQGIHFFKGWINSIDFLIVFLGFIFNLITTFQQNNEIYILSSLIIIRPLTTIINIQSFELIACAISFSIPLLKESLMILLFFILIFTISGVNLFSGYLKKRCFEKETGLLMFSNDSESYLCEDDSFCQFEGFNENTFICGKILENPNWDLTSFDTFFYSFLVVFQTCTLGAWNDIMIEVQQTFSVFSALYFVIIVIIGALVLLNLILAVLKVKFSEYKEEWIKEKFEKKEGKIKRYSFQKLSNMKIFIGNQGKKKALMGKGKSVLLKLKGLRKLVTFGKGKNKISKKKSQEIVKNKNEIDNNESVLSSNNKGNSNDKTDSEYNLTNNEKINNETNNNEINNKPNNKNKFNKSLFNLINNINKNKTINNTPPKSVKKVIESKQKIFNFPSKNIKFLPIRLNIPHNLREPLNLRTSEVPLMTTEFEDFLTLESHQKSPSLLKTTDENTSLDFENLIFSSKRSEKTERNPDFQALFSKYDLDKDFIKEPNPINLNKNDYMEENKPIKQLKLNTIVPMPINDSLDQGSAFPRLSHGFSFVKERQNLKKMEEKIKEENKKNDDISMNTDNFDLDYDDPELPFLKALNPKHLKLDVNPEKPYESSSTMDILLEKCNINRKNTNIKKKTMVPRLLNALNYSKKFYKENIASLIKAKNKERNLTRLLLAGQTMKKLNKMKLPLFFSLDTEFLCKQLKDLKTPKASNVDNDRYFFKVQNLIMDQRGSIMKSGQRSKTLKKSRIDTLNISSNRDFRDQDINEIKKLYFGESEFNLNQLSEERISSSDDDEVERIVNTANFEATSKQENSNSNLKITTSALLLNVKLQHILKTSTNIGDQEEIDEAKKQRIYKKAKIKQEFAFFDSAEKTFQEDLKTNEKDELPIAFWSGEDVYDYNPEFYRYSNDGVHIVKRFRTLVKALNYTIKNYDIWEAGIQGKCNFLRKKVLYLVNSDFFVRLMLFFVLINTILLSINGIIELNDEENEKVDTANTVFTIFFTGEVVLKVIGLGILGYFRDKFNIFDCFIVTISLIEWIVMSNNTTSFSAFRALSFFRTIRILRVSRLLRSLKYANVLAQKISDSLQSCLKIALILLIFIYIYALLGMTIYQGKFIFSDIRQNFETFPNSLIIVFQLITISNWNSILYGCLRTSISKFFSMIYLCSAVVIGNYLLLNLLLAILLDVFAKDSSKEVKNYLDAQEVGEDLLEEKEKKVLENLITNGDEKNKEEEQEKHKATFKRFLHKFNTNFKEISESDSQGTTSNFDLEDILEKEVCEKSYYMFLKSNKLRILCAKVLRNQIFQIFCQISIILSLIQLILYTYIYDSKNSFDNSLKMTTLVLELYINSFFLAEFLLQTINHGFLEQWRFPWSKLNILILGASFFLLIVDEIARFSKFMNYMRPLRIIIVLRAFSYNEKYRYMVSALLHSIKAITSLVFMILLIWLIFSIIGVSFLQDKMGYCDVENPYYISKSVCEDQLHQEWKIRDNNFDNILNGLLTLFVLSFFEGFPVLVYQFLDAGPEDTGPTPNNSQYMIIYFVIFAVVSAIFLMNLFICVIFMHYIIAEKREKTSFLTDEQSRWIAIQRLLVKETPDYSYIKLPDERLRRFFYQLTKSRYFEIFIFLCIILNTISMAIYYEGSPKNYQNILLQINLSISIIFIIEAGLKLIAVGFGGYFYSGWNKLDFFVVLTSIFDIWLEFSNENDYNISQEITRGLKVLRVARLLRLIKSYSGLQKLFLTSVYSLPYLINAFAILFLVYFMFTVLAVFLFRNITYTFNDFCLLFKNDF